MIWYWILCAEFVVFYLLACKLASLVDTKRTRRETWKQDHPNLRWEDWKHLQ